MSTAPWIKKTLAKNRDVFKDNPAPKYDQDGTLVTFGSGHYGCVMPTDTQNIVLKVTSDATEIEFIKLYMRLKSKPEGIVEYYNLIETSQTYRGRPVALIYRDEARNVGYDSLQNIYSRTKYDQRCFEQGTNSLAVAKLAASKILETIKRRKNINFDLIKDKFRLYAGDIFHIVDGVMKSYEDFPRIKNVISSRPRGDMGVAFLLGIYYAALEQVESNCTMYEVGSFMREMLNAGVVVADLHANNIGHHIDDEVTIVTDPGHVFTIGLEKEYFKE